MYTFIRISVLALILSVLTGLLPLDAEAFVTPWQTVPVDANGQMIGVTSFYHAPSGTTIFVIDQNGVLTLPTYTPPSGVSGAAEGTDTYFANLKASTVISGASPITAHVSGTSLVSMGTYVYHSGSGSSIYGLPLIPTTGVSIPYVMFDVGPAGGGITVYPTAAQPFLGSGISGTSYLALPPGNPFKSATLFGVVDESGTSPYWRVKADSGWVAGN